MRGRRDEVVVFAFLGRMVLGDGRGGVAVHLEQGRTRLLRGMRVFREGGLLEFG